jgi:DNA-binding NarL/FixJ family response regulator
VDLARRARHARVSIRLRRRLVQRPPRAAARLIALGLSNAEVAARLVISERTAEAHAEHIRDKLDVRTRAQIARWVVERQGRDPRAG